MRQELKNLRFPAYGRMTVTLFPELTGRRLDDSVLGLLIGLRPSCIRISGGELTTDAVLHRLTVIVDDCRRIEKISMEMEVGLANGVQNGHELAAKVYAKV